MGSLTNLGKLCRLCSLEVDYGFDIFVESEVKASLVILINKYLPIKVTEDELLPKKICESCHIGVAATVDLIDRMVEGQHKLRKLLQKCLRKLTLAKAQENLDANLDRNQTNNFLFPETLKEIPDNILATGNSNSEDPTFNSISKTDECVKIENNTLDSLLADIDMKFFSDNQEKPLVPGTILYNGEQPLDELSEKNPDVGSHTLINIQGNTPDIEMDDLAKGTEVKKVYESHPLGLIVEGNKPKRKRGRPRKDSKDRVVPKKVVLPIPEENEGLRPKRRTNPPSRFRDTVDLTEVNKILRGSAIRKGREMEISQADDTLSPFSNYFLNTKEKTHTLDGNTITVTSNHRDESLSNLPAAVNIELDFNDLSFLNEQGDDGSGEVRPPHAPKALVSEINEDALLDPVEEIDKEEEFVIRKKFKKKKGPGKKAKFFCEFCNKGFLHMGKYLFHLKLHKNVILQCEECKERFQTRDDINLHQESSNHTGIGLLELENTGNDKSEIKCSLCTNRSFISEERYKSHVANMHHGQKPHLCLICDKRFSYKHSLKNHYLMHQPAKNKKIYPCKKCCTVFQHQSSLSYHMLTRHNDQRNYVCALCGCAFKLKQLLQRHYLVHSEDRPFMCKECGSCFKTPGNLYNHMNCHNKVKCYTCEHCSKGFRHKTSLNLHLRSHTGEKPFVCSHCGKQFSQNGNMQEHLRIHTGEKPFCCSQCGKKFTTFSQLSSHEKRHKMECKFKCTTCLKAFFTSEALAIHNRKHEEQKCFTCKFCPKTFVEKTQLSKHQKTHTICDIKTEKKLLKCATCGKTFTDQFLFEKHSETHILEKAWFIAQPSVVDTAITEVAAPPSANNQDIIYILPKKDDANNLGFISFGTDEIFDADAKVHVKEDLVGSHSVVNTITNSFILPQDVQNQSVVAKVAYPVQNQIEVGDSTFEISLKETDTLPFTLPMQDDTPLYFKS